jgi:DNA-binding CsgD family transcriptional regulator
MKNPQLPAGLADKNLEIYFHDGELKAIYQGKTQDFIELPGAIRDIFEVHLIRDTAAVHSLQHDMNILDGTDMLIQYVKCVFGGFDLNPDLRGTKTTPECWDCGYHGTCPGEGKVCKMPAGPMGVLSKREYQVAILAAKGKFDKEIAFELHLEESSVREYLKRVRCKVEANNRIELMLWAQRMGLI